MALRMYTKEGHHTAIKKVCNVTLHLHVDIFDKHAIYDGDGFKVHCVLFQFGLAYLYVLDMLLIYKVHVSLVSGSLLLEASHTLL